MNVRGMVKMERMVNPNSFNVFVHPEDIRVIVPAHSGVHYPQGVLTRVDLINESHVFVRERAEDIGQRISTARVQIAQDQFQSDTP